MLKVLNRSELENNPQAELTPVEALFEQRKPLVQSYMDLSARFYDPILEENSDEQFEAADNRLCEIDKLIVNATPISINDIVIQASVVKFWQDFDDIDGSSLDGFDAKLVRNVAAFFPLEV